MTDSVIDVGRGRATRRSRLLRLTALVLVGGLLAGCGAGRAYRRGAGAARAGNWDVAVDEYRKAVQKNPDEPSYQIALERAMINASVKHLDEARLLEARGQIEDALREYRRASEYDPPNRQLAAKVLEVERRLRDEAEAAQRARVDAEQLRNAARTAGPQPLFGLNQVLPAMRFQDTSTRTILTAIAQAAEINVLYDPTFADRPQTIDLQNQTLEQALNNVLLLNQLFFKVVNPRTILVSPDTLQKRTQYEDQVIRTFFISHTDAAEVVQTLNQVVRLGNQFVQPQIAINKTGNSITVRGTATLVAIVDRLIETIDNPRAEIIVDVQILEVNRRRVRQFGLDLTNFAVNGAFSPEADPRATTGTGTGTGNGTTTGTELTPRPFNANSITRGISTADFYLAVPAAVVRFLASDSETKLIAKPQLRGAEGQKLLLSLGEEIPVPATTFTPLAQGGANFNPLTSFNYRPIGVNLELTPRVTLEGDIILDLMVENSARGADVSVAGTTVPGFVSRKVTTRLRLRDGESNLLAGLISETERKSLRGLPGLVRLPLLRSLFAANDNEINQTDIVMLLTPRVIRTQELTPIDLGPIFIGSGSSMALGGAPPLIAPLDLPIDPVTTTPATPAPVPPPAGPLAPGGAISVVPPGSGPIPGTTTIPAAPAVPPPAVPSAPAAPPASAVPPPQTTTPVPAPPAPAPPVAAAAASGQIVVTPPGTEFRVGAGPYTVPISVTGASRLSSVVLTLSFNPAVIRVRTVQEGSFMRAGGANATFTQQADPATGRIDITIARTADATGVAGTGLLAALLFDAVAPGAADLTITGTATAPGGAPLTLQFAAIPGVTVR